MPKEKIKYDSIHFRCEEEFKKQIQDYVDTYNERYGHIKKTNLTEVIEEAIREYLRWHSDRMPIIERGEKTY